MYELLPHLRSDIQIAPEPGQAIVLVGENGIGKSTYLKHHHKTSGGIFCDQRPLDVFFDRTVSDFKKIILGSSQILEKDFFEHFWNISGLSEKESRRLSHLSGGEAQLLKIISICSASGQHYLLDEPGHYLDREKKKLLGTIIRNLMDKKKSLLIVEHDYSWIPAGALINELHQEQNVLKVKSSWTI